MPKIRYQHAHSLDAKDAHQRITALVGQFAEKFGFTTDWERDDLALVKGRGISGSVELQPGKVVFDLDLALLLSPFKAKIEQGIAQQLEQALR